MGDKTNQIHHVLDISSTSVDPLSMAPHNVYFDWITNVLVIRCSHYETQMYSIT